MALKVLYFTAGPIPTPTEQAEIAQLSALASQPFDIGVRSATTPAQYQPKYEEADYVCGTPPAPYDDDEEYPVFDLDAPPAGSNLPGTSAVVSDGQAVVVGAETYTFTVVDGVITEIAVA